jgi:hypothetical protein
MKLWLDDVRPAPPGWLWVKTYDEAIRELTGIAIERFHGRIGVVREELTHMSFDHDLADVSYRIANAEMQGRPTDHYVSEKTGYDVALWMAEHEVWPTEECRVHSFNPVGAKRICGVVDRYGPYDKRCVWVPLDLRSQELPPRQLELMKRMADS